MEKAISHLFLIIGMGIFMAMASGLEEHHLQMQEQKLEQLERIDSMIVLDNSQDLKVINTSRWFIIIERKNTHDD